LLERPKVGINDRIAVHFHGEPEDRVVAVADSEPATPSRDATEDVTAVGIGIRIGIEPARFINRKQHARMRQRSPPVSGAFINDPGHCRRVVPETR
jgi:hypothetical protein